MKDTKFLKNTKSSSLGCTCNKDVLPSFIKKDKKDSIKEIIKIILFEDNKVSKILYTLKGYVDYKRNKFGKINE